jgi:hypothetical protein
MDIPIQVSDSDNIDSGGLNEAGDGGRCSWYGVGEGVDKFTVYQLCTTLYRRVDVPGPSVP